MRNLFELIAHLFYRYYNKGSTKVIAYESALIAISALIFLNLFSVLIFLNVDTTWVSRIEQEYGRSVKLLSGLFLILPQYIILRYTLRKDDISKKQIDLNQIKKCNALLISYIIFSVVMLIFAIKIKV